MPVEPSSTAPSLRWVLIVVLTLTLALVLYALHMGWIPASDQICEQGHYPGEETCTAHDPAFVALRNGFKILQEGSEALIALGTIALAIFTYTLWRATDRLLTSAREEGERMERSIAEAGKAAVAMQGVAAASNLSVAQVTASVANQKMFGQMQMRAYLSVLIGGATFQEGQKGLKFGSSPLLKNTGFTTARKIRWRIGVAILPVPLPPDFKFPLPADQPGKGIIGAQQDGNMSAVLAEFIDEAEVEAIKQGFPKSLYTWGYVRYEDVFGRLHRNVFAQQLFWIPNGPGMHPPEIVRGLHLAKHNRSN